MLTKNCMLPALIHARLSRLRIQEVQRDGAQLVLTPFPESWTHLRSEFLGRTSALAMICVIRLALSLPKARQRTLPASCKRKAPNYWRAIADSAVPRSPVLWALNPRAEHAVKNWVRDTVTSRTWRHGAVRVPYVRYASKWLSHWG